MARNITLSVDEEVLSQARRYAAETDQTVNGLVREFLAGIAARRDRAASARARMLQMSRGSRARIGEALPDRHQLHAR